jgi:hypothetical protein
MEHKGRISTTELYLPRLKSNIKQDPVFNNVCIFKIRIQILYQIQKLFMMNLIIN